MQSVLLVQAQAAVSAQKARRGWARGGDDNDDDKAEDTEDGAVGRDDTDKSQGAYMHFPGELRRIQTPMWRYSELG
jgi:hypothetical protein